MLITFFVYKLVNNRRRYRKVKEFLQAIDLTFDYGTIKRKFPRDVGELPLKNRDSSIAQGNLPKQTKTELCYPSLNFDRYYLL